MKRQVKEQQNMKTTAPLLTPRWRLHCAVDLRSNLVSCSDRNSPWWQQTSRTIHDNLKWQVWNILAGNVSGYLFDSDDVLVT